MRGLIAHYPLMSDGKDALGTNAPPELKNVEFRPEGFYLNGGYEHRPGNGYRAVFPASGLSYGSLGFSVDLLPLDFKPEASVRPWRAWWHSLLSLLRIDSSSASSSHENVIALGPSYRWFCVKHRSGHLELTLNNNDYKQSVPGAVLAPGKWHRLMVSLDLNSRTILSSLDGKILPPVQIPKDLKLSVIGSPAEATERVITFSDYSNGSAYHGYAADLRAFDHALSRLEMESLAGDRAWEKRPLPPGAGSKVPLLLLAILISAAVAWFTIRHRNPAVRR